MTMWCSYKIFLHEQDRLCYDVGGKAGDPMRVRFLFRSVIVAATLAFFGGCTPISPSGTIEPQPEMRAMTQPVAPPPPPPPPASAAPAAPPTPSNAETSEEPTDETIGFQIRRLLNADPTTSAGFIIEVDGGNVTLRGTAVARAAAWRAEAAARSVKGVKSVVNQIIVNTPSVTQ
jgi:hypothetical protein